MLCRIKHFYDGYDWNYSRNTGRRVMRLFRYVRWQEGFIHESELVAGGIGKTRRQAGELGEQRLAALQESERLRENLRLTTEKLLLQQKETGGIQQLMADQFRNLASEILEDKARRFTETNREKYRKNTATFE